MCTFGFIVHEVSLQISISSIFNYYSSIFYLLIPVFFKFFLFSSKEKMKLTKQKANLTADGW